MRMGDSRSRVFIGSLTHWASKRDTYLLITRTESISYLLKEYIIVNAGLKLLSALIPWVFGLSPLQRLHAKPRRQGLKFV